MGTDYAHKEREFIDALGADTGRDLAAWMHAIDAAGLAHRNDIIDWLRQQGFPFPKASWLERIHHNDGHLIYADGVPSAPLAVRPVVEPKREHAQVPAEPSRPPKAPAVRRDTGDVAVVLAGAKGLRPLAEVVLREIHAAVPGIALRTTPPHIVFEAPEPFAALNPTPKELRLYANFGKAGEGQAKRAEVSQLRGAPPFPEVLILNDARQIGAGFRELVAAAYMHSLE